MRKYITLAACLFLLATSLSNASGEDKASKDEGVSINNDERDLSNEEKSSDEIIEQVYKIADESDVVIEYDQNDLNEERVLSIHELSPDKVELERECTQKSGTSDFDVKIFSSIEKSSNEQNNNWLLQVAEKFNENGIVINESGKLTLGKVVVCNIPSGEAYRLIASDKNLPHAYTPSNNIWMKLLPKYRTELLYETTKSLVKNSAGFAVRKDLIEEISHDPSKIDEDIIIEKIHSGQISLIATDPFISSTGINFLLSSSRYFNEKTNTQDDYQDQFRNFLKTINFSISDTISLTKKLGLVSAEIALVEYQTFLNDEEFRKNYDFFPFGQPHNNPLYILDKDSKDFGKIRTILEAFVDLTSKSQDLASKMQFNQNPEYQKKYRNKPMNVEELSTALKIWTNRSERSKAIFLLVDTSFSMNEISEGNKLRKIDNVKSALRYTVDLIHPRHEVGIASFSGKIRLLRPIEKFNPENKARYLRIMKNVSPERIGTNDSQQYSEVDELQIDSSRGTALYKSIIYSLDKLSKKISKNPEYDPILIVFSDFDNKDQFEYGNLPPVVRKFGISIHTFGFDANEKQIEKISSLVEAASISQANDSNVFRKAAELFNVELTEPRR